MPVPSDGGAVYTLFVASSAAGANLLWQPASPLLFAIF
jgi:hypothetical protein